MVVHTWLTSINNIIATQAHKGNSFSKLCSGKAKQIPQQIHTGKNNPNRSSFLENNQFWFLVDTPVALDKLRIYQTSEIINSPYNQFQPSKGLSSHLRLRKQHFLSLSWMIAELGKIKDKGLPIESLVHLFIEIENLDEEVALQKVSKTLGSEYPTVNELLNASSNIVSEFISSPALEDLVVEWSIKSY